MAQHSGFFNAKLVDGAYDRRYNAEDYRGNLGAVISNGVRRSGDDDLKVQAVGGSMDYTVSIGRAWINGGWYFNDSTYIPNEEDDTLIAIGNSTLPRIDRIVVRFNSNDAVRDIYIARIEGTPSASPVAPDPVRTDKVYDIVLADIYVGAGVLTINQTNVTDQRANKDVCGWITTPVGYDDFFVSVDNKILEHIEIIDGEWQNMKDKWASVTLFKKYESAQVLDSAKTRIPVDITQYDSTVDILEVFVNGIYVKEGVDYELDGNTVVFFVEKPFGTNIAFSVYKSINGSGDIESFLSIVTDLQNQVSDLSVLDEYNYICTGVNDNVKISELCQSFFDGTDDGEEIKINIYGTFGAQSAMDGEGTSTNRKKWFNVSPTGSVSRKVTLDFSHCSKIVLPVTDGSYNIVFHGKDMTIIGANVEVNNIATNTAIEIFSSTEGNIKAVRCRFNLTGYHRTFIAETGTFENCVATCTVMNGHGYCFYTHANGLIRIFGGEYKAYTQASSSNSMVLYQTDAGSVSITYGMNCPIVTKSGYRQTHAVNATGGTATVRDTITTLTIVASTQSVTVAQNKPDRG